MNPTDVFKREDVIELRSYSTKDLLASLEKRPRKDRLWLRLWGTIDKNYKVFFEKLKNYLKNNPLKYVL